VSSPLEARADTVGSLLRPPELLEGANASRGTSSPELRSSVSRMERSTTRYLQEESGLDVVTDGEILREEVAELVRLGATYIQLDARHYPLLIDPAHRAFYESRGWPADRRIELGTELDNIDMGGHPEVVLGFYLCRGNEMSRGAAAPRVRRGAVGLLRRARWSGRQDGRCSAS
jgi:methionine synthase II (cobalamin-independent)